MTRSRSGTMGILTAALLLAASGAWASPPPAGSIDKIRDNLFLLEEAYNQEPGVIQHIQVLTVAPRTNTWSYNFTEEWPAPTDLHQLSVTLPVLSAERDSAQLGDLLLNYRLQALGLGGIGSLAVAPRLSLVLPTGDYRIATGRGVVGLQLNLPASIDLSPHLVAHVNAGLTVTPGAKSPTGASASTVDTSAGFALVWLPFTWVNALIEVAHLTTEEVAADQKTARGSRLLANPGVRFAVTFPSGLQIVPGVSLPVQLAPDSLTLTVLAYLSFEHPAWRAP